MEIVNKWLLQLQPSNHISGRKKKKEDKSPLSSLNAYVLYTFSEVSTVDFRLGHIGQTRAHSHSLTSREPGKVGYGLISNPSFGPSSLPL